MTKLFYAVLANSLVASLTNTFVWFAVTFWVYLQTKSVLVTSVMAGIYLLTVATSGFFLGSLVDRYKKKTAMMFSSLGSLFYTYSLTSFLFLGQLLFLPTLPVSFFGYLLSSLYLVRSREIYV